MDIFRVAFRAVTTETLWVLVFVSSDPGPGLEGESLNAFWTEEKVSVKELNMQARSLFFRWIRQLGSDLWSQSLGRIGRQISVSLEPGL